MNTSNVRGAMSQLSNLSATDVDFPSEISGIFSTKKESQVIVNTYEDDLGKVLGWFGKNKIMPVGGTIANLDPFGKFAIWVTGSCYKDHIKDSTASKALNVSISPSNTEKIKIYSLKGMTITGALGDREIHFNRLQQICGVALGNLETVIQKELNMHALTGAGRVAFSDIGYDEVVDIYNDQHPESSDVTKAVISRIINASTSKNAHQLIGYEKFCDPNMAVANLMKMGLQSNLTPMTLKISNEKIIKIIQKANENSIPFSIEMTQEYLGIMTVKGYNSSFDLESAIEDYKRNMNKLRKQKQKVIARTNVLTSTIEIPPIGEESKA